MKYAEMRRAVRELQAQVVELKNKIEARPSAHRVNGNGHDKLSLLQSDLSEQALFDLGMLMSEYRVLGEKLDYAMGRWAHVRRGCSVDDRADKWVSPNPDPSPERNRRSREGN